MRKLFAFVIYIFIVTSCSLHKEKDNYVGENNKLQDSLKGSYTNIKITGIKGGKVIFDNGKDYTTNLFDLKYITQLRGQKKELFLVLAGKDCNNCDENLSIFIISPSDGPMKSEEQQKRYQYPGDELDYVTQKLVFQSRMFYGNCIENKGTCIVWYRKDMSSSPQESFFIVSVKNNKIVETELPFSQNVLDRIIKNCNEVKGIQTTTEP